MRNYFKVIKLTQRPKKTYRELKQIYTYKKTIWLFTLKKEKKLNSYVTPFIRIKRWERAGGREKGRRPSQITFKHGNERLWAKYQCYLLVGRILICVMFTAGCTWSAYNYSKQAKILQMYGIAYWEMLCKLQNCL